MPTRRSGPFLGLLRAEPLADDDPVLMRLIDEIHLERPFYGWRRIRGAPADWGHAVNRKHVQRLMRQMGIMALYPRKPTSAPAPGHAINSWRLAGRTIERPNRVWVAVLTYLPMAHDIIYMLAITDWYRRKVLAWRVSNSLDSAFCMDGRGRWIYNVVVERLRRTVQYENAHLRVYDWAAALRRTLERYLSFEHWVT